MIDVGFYKAHLKAYARKRLPAAILTPGWFLAFFTNNSRRTLWPVFWRFDQDALLSFERNS